jgi:hypothetical protein
MNSDILYERDMLYPTININEPGSIHLQVYYPNKSARIPVVIEGKTNHSPVKYINSIIRIMQSDIFDRIFIDMKKNIDIYIKAGAELSAEYGGKAFVKVSYKGDIMGFTGADSIE